METLTLEIRSPETLTAIAEVARFHGTTMEACALRLLETAILAQRPFEEIVEPIARSFEQSEMTEEELDDLIDEAKRNAREEKRRKN